MAVEPLRTLRPTTGWVALDLRELAQFQDLLVEFARRDVKLRYRQTLLGVAWVLLQPLVAAGVLTFAFGVVAGLKPAPVDTEPGPCASARNDCGLLVLERTMCV